MKALIHSLYIGILISAVPAFSAVTVSIPANGAAITSPFALSATATPCSLQPAAAMGYSLDNGVTTTASGSSIVATVVAASGPHILHVKSWGNKGASCVTDVIITVSSPTQSQLPVTDVTVASPANGASIASPFPLSAGGTLCSSQPISAMGYSLDGSAATTAVTGTTIATSVATTAGPHTLHVKSWGNKGASCVADRAITVVTPPTAVSGPTIPANAIAVKAIQNLNTWQSAFDEGTGGTASSSGAMKLVTSPALSGSARQFITTYSNYGGHRYSTRFAVDQAATNFVLDTAIYLASPINDIANIEIDMNQVMANGQTVIYGFQCDSWSRSWDYTANLGTPSSPKDQWIHSNQPCNPQTWTTNTWHHVQISYSRDNAGNVTYKSVWLDGVKQDLNVTTASSFALGWAPTLLANIQIDGMTALPGTATIYLDNLTVYRW